MTDLFKGENLTKTALSLAGFYVLFVLLIGNVTGIDSALLALQANLPLLITILGGFWIADNFVEPKINLKFNQNILLGGFISSALFLFFNAGFDFTFIAGILTQSLGFSFIALGVFSLVFGKRGGSD